MTSRRAFFDTNVLVYLAERTAGRDDEVRTLLKRSDALISVQVLNELAAVLRRKGVAWPTLTAFLAELKPALTILPLTTELHERGLGISERYGYRVYDSLLLAAALEAGCDTFWSEDLQDGQVIEGALTIRNPFAVA